MVRESDLLIDFQKISDELLNKFTHIFEKKGKNVNDKVSTKKVIDEKMDKFFEVNKK